MMRKYVESVVYIVYRLELHHKIYNARTNAERLKQNIVYTRQGNQLAIRPTSSHIKLCRFTHFCAKCQ